MPETRKGRRRAAVTAAATAAIAPMAVPAIAPDSAAASPPPYCGSNTVCVYEGPNFSQSIGYLSQNVGDTNLADNRFVDGSTMNDNISAIWNNSNKWAHFCQNPTCGTSGGTSVSHPASPAAISSSTTTRSAPGSRTPRGPSPVRTRSAVRRAARSRQARERRPAQLRRQPGARDRGRSR